MSAAPPPLHDRDEPDRSVWALRAPPAPETAPLRGEVRADVAVVGAGYTGLSTALHLAGRGVRAVVLEAHEVGSGSSGRSNGQVIPTLKREDPDALLANLGPVHGERMIALIRDAADFVFGLIREHGIDCDAEQTGWIQPAHTVAHLRVAEARRAQWAAHGADVAVLDREEVGAALGTDRYLGGWTARRGGHINPLAYVRGLAAAALRRGAAVHMRSPALAVERAGRSWRVRTPEGALTAERVLLATNAYTDDLWPGLRRSIVPVSFYQVATTPLSDNVRAAVIPGRQAVSDMRRDLYFFRYDGANRLISGGTFILTRNWRERLRRRVTRRLAEVFPQITEPRFEAAWTGAVAMTRDHFPHLHEPAPGVTTLIGCNGRGIALTTAMGRMLADWLAGALPAADLPLPMTAIRPLPAHGLFTRLAPGMMAWYRAQDRYEAARGRISA